MLEVQGGEEIQPGHLRVALEDPEQAGLLAVAAELEHLGITSIMHRIRAHLSRPIRNRLHLSRIVLSRQPQRRTPLTRAAHRAEATKQPRRNTRQGLHIREIPEQERVLQIIKIGAGNLLCHMEHVALPAV